MVLLYLVRHGEAQHNVADTTVRTEESHLTPLGVTQAKITGQYLKKYLPKNTRVLTSSLIRTIETANIIINEIWQETNPPTIKSLQLFDKLGPSNLPVSISSEAQQIIKDFEDKHKNDPIGYQTGFVKCVKGLDKKFKEYLKPQETVLGCRRRVKRMIKFINDLADDTTTILLVVHSSVISDITSEVLSLPLYVVPKGYGKNPTSNCSITIFDINSDTKNWCLILPTSTSHITV